jgi:hypothetical protein
MAPCSQLGLSSQPVTALRRPSFSAWQTAWQGVRAAERVAGGTSRRDDFLGRNLVMPKKRRRKSTRRETMQRNAIISSFTPRMRLGVRGANDPEPEVEGRRRLELRGTLVEPIRDIKDIVFKLWPDPEKRVGPARPAAVGDIMGIRPAVDVAVLHSDSARVSPRVTARQRVQATA